MSASKDLKDTTVDQDRLDRFTDDADTIEHRKIIRSKKSDTEKVSKK